MYNNSAPTKVAATTKQVFENSIELNCNYEIVTGYVDNKPASIFTSYVEEIRSVEEGGNTDEVKPLIKPVNKKIEAVEGFGSRTNGGDWNPQGTIWSIGRGGMALNLDKKCLVDVVYEDHTLTFTVPAEHVATVIGENTSYISGDVQVTIVDDGAVITSVELHYTIAADEANNLPKSDMTVKVVYTYDLEKITIQ